jgi:membrane fusion protein, adhesin transport system
MPVNPQNVSSFQRVWDDLVVHLRDGNVIRISHFYMIAPRARLTRIIWTLCALVGIAIVVAYFETLDEVTTGTDKVVPSMQEQVIQSLEGGILAKINVRQDDVVKSGQIPARLDPTMTASSVEDNSAQYLASLARMARLQAEVNQTPLSFPKQLEGYPDLIAKETSLYNERRRGLTEPGG